MKDEDVIGFLIDREDVQASCYMSQFSVMDNENVEFWATWFGELLIGDVIYYTLPKTVTADKNGEVILYRRFAEYYDEPNIVIPLE